MDALKSGELRDCDSQDITSPVTEDDPVQHYMRAGGMGTSGLELSSESFSRHCALCAYPEIVMTGFTTSPMAVLDLRLHPFTNAFVSMTRPDLAQSPAAGGGGRATDGFKIGLGASMPGFV